MNYSLSREIEEGALAPRSKIWLTEEQAEGHEKKLATLNTNTDPVQFYNFDPRQGPNQIPTTGGAQINPGLRTVSEAMRQMIGMQAGMFAANMGDNPGLQSGVAIEALQDRGDNGNNKYSTAREIAQAHTARILVNAIPRVYKPGRQMRLLNEDGSYQIRPIGDPVPDQQTGEVKYLYDLSMGTYDVICESGPSFKNRQTETVKAITDIAQVDPTIIELGKDILTKNIPSPGMDQLSERARKQLFNAGLIPVEQMTDEERQQLELMQQQGPQEDPAMVLARAEEGKAQADLIDAQTKQVETQATLQLKQQELALKQQELQVKSIQAETDRMEAQIKLAEAQASIQKNTADAAKSLAEAEAQDIENAATESGIMDLVGRLNG